LTGFACFTIQTVRRTTCVRTSVGAVTGVGGALVADGSSARVVSEPSPTSVTAPATATACVLCIDAPGEEGALTMSSGAFHHEAKQLQRLGKTFRGVMPDRAQRSLVVVPCGAGCSRGARATGATARGAASTAVTRAASAVVAPAIVARVATPTSRPTRAASARGCGRVGLRGCRTEGRTPHGRRRSRS
jgi:hypothetical protein